MHDLPRGPLAIPDEVIELETGRKSEAWYILLDAGGARSFSHAQLLEHLERIYGLEPRWASTIAVRYEAARGIEREVNVPADLVAALFFKAAARRKFEQLSRADQRSLITWLDEAEDAQERKARIESLIERLESS